MRRRSDKLKKLNSRVSNEISEALDSEPEESSIWLWIEADTESDDTGGWCTEIGGLGKTAPYIQIWLDRFSGTERERLYVGFASRPAKHVRQLIEVAPRRWQPIRVVTADRIVHGGHPHMKEPLRPEEYGKTIEEHHSSGWHFYGIYDPMDSLDRDDPKATPGFVNLAIAFLTDIARTQQSVSPMHDVDEDAFLNEGRQVVRQHLVRERDKKAAEKRKRKDKYKCAVCKMRFEERYGKIGRRFAEAHHIRPISTLKRGEKPQMKDLITVCSNCHRMLHRMDGKPEDVARLAAMVEERRELSK